MDNFCDFLDKLNHVKHKIVISGNHELTFDEETFYPNLLNIERYKKAFS